VATTKISPVSAQVEVTPRFEVFYALQALEGGSGKELAGWRRDAEATLSARVRTEISSVAPSAIMWPLLADALRDAAPAPEFEEMIAALRKMDARAFQQSVLNGVFKGPRAVARLVSRSQSLEQTVKSESATRGKLLSLLGLHPFVEGNASSRTFERIISDPAGYRTEVVSVLESFWNECFRDTWRFLERDMQRVAARMRDAIARDGFEAFATDNHMPITGDRSSTIYILPSAFNTSRLWASYQDERGRRRYFIPLFDRSLSLDPRSEARDEIDTDTSVEPSLVFKALGDTTRYAIASVIAHTPMTSVELARMFKVSKPTISHHVQLFRAANLLIEEPGENGVVLSLNRAVLEGASFNAAREMFSPSDGSQMVKRTRRANHHH
jgi:DNA-binding transcriptional ArsR family regulator